MSTLKVLKKEDNDFIVKVPGKDERQLETPGYVCQDNWRSWIGPSDRPQQNFKGDIYRESNDSSRTQPAYEAAGSGETRAWP